MKRFLFLALLGAAGAFVFRTFFYEGIYIASESMEPTLPKDRHVMVNKFAYSFRVPKRGDIVMIERSLGAHKGLVKRVIAVGGETIEIRAKKVYINGRFLDEPYVQYLKPDTIFMGDNLGPVMVPRDTVFVMGDNRDVSGDSRDWKGPDGQRTPFVPFDDIKGLVQ